MEIENDDGQAVEAFGAVDGTEGNNAAGVDEAVVEGDTADAGAAGQGGSFQGAAPREDGDLFGPTPPLAEPMAQEAVDSGEFLSRLNAFFQHVGARGEWDDLVQAGDEVGGRGGIELFKIGQDRVGVTDGSLNWNADRIEPGIAQELRRIEGSFTERRSLCGVVKDADPGTGTAVEQGPINRPPSSLARTPRSGGDHRGPG